MDQDQTAARAVQDGIGAVQEKHRDVILPIGIASKVFQSRVDNHQVESLPFKERLEHLAAESGARAPVLPDCLDNAGPAVLVSPTLFVQSGCRSRPVPPQITLLSRRETKHAQARDEIIFVRALRLIPTMKRRKDSTDILYNYPEAKLRPNPVSNCLTVWRWHGDTQNSSRWCQQLG